MGTTPGTHDRTTHVPRPAKSEDAELPVSMPIFSVRS